MLLKEEEKRFIQLFWFSVKYQNGTSCSELIIFGLEKVTSIHRYSATHVVGLFIRDVFNLYASLYQ